MTASGGGGPSDEERAQKREEFKETFRVIKEMSDILNTGLDTESLGFCLRLCEEGVNPAALALLIKGWRKNSTKGRRLGQGQEDKVSNNGSSSNNNPRS